MFTIPLRQLADSGIQNSAYEYIKDKTKTAPLGGFSFLYCRDIYFSAKFFILGIFHPAEKHFNLIEFVDAIVVYWVAIGGEYPFLIPVT